MHGGWLYKAGIMSYHQYKHYRHRAIFNVMRKGGGKGRPALIEWLTIQPKYRKIIIEKYGDPEKMTAQNGLTRHLEFDTKAQTFFREYEYDSGKGLTKETIAEYTANASIYNAVIRYVANRRSFRRKLGKNRASDIWDEASRLISQLDTKQWPHRLPSSVRRLKPGIKEYKEMGYKSLIHRNFGNKNSEKVNNDAKQWLLARWGNQVKRVPTLAHLLECYNEKATREGWKLLQEEKTLYNFLYTPEIESIWYGHRYGELQAKKRGVYQHSTKLPGCRDALWYGDGTKLNYFYLHEGKIKTCQVYEVIDSYSEVLLGYHISHQENYKAQYSAFRMAIQNAGHRPYQISVDNQGGHKKLETGNFLNNICRIAIKTQPHNPNSKTIESVFGRFQKQYLAQDWFFTGQNVTAKSDRSHANMEFILSNRDKLPSLEEIKKIYAKRRKQWNEAPHFATDIPKIKMYEESVNEKAPAVSIWDMVDWFFVERSKPVTITPYGIQFTEQKQTYTYMVYKDDGLPDLEWLNRHIDQRVHIKFDPEDMSSIYMYEFTPLGLRFLKEATTKIEIYRAIQDQDEWEAKYIRQIQDAANALRITRRDEMDEILAKHGMRAEDYGLNSPGIAGIEGNKKTKVGKKRCKAAKKQDKVAPATVGAEMKSIANLTELEEEPLDLYSRY